ncbi:MAG: sulfatase-like hydrolase/transferase, partial [Odoribacter sp.]|nr:sulfatase-like hydrolase/transferase [Odoribacter sp.]
AVGKWHLGLGKGQVDWNREIVPGAREVGFDYSFITAATNDRVPTVFVENGRVANLDPNDPIEVSYRKNFPGEPTGKENPELLKIKPSHGHNQSITNGIPRIGFMRGGKSALWVDEDMADTFLSKATGFVKEHRDEPFFLYYALHEPHVPRVPHPRFAGKSPLGPRGDVVLEADWCVGEFLNTLDSLGLSENTIVIFTSDNGPILDDGYVDEAIERLGDHKPAGPFRSGKYSSYDGGTHVAFLVRWTGHIKPGKSEALVCQMDFCAAFANMLGKENETRDGENVLDALLGRSKQGRKELLLDACGNNVLLRQGDWICIPPMVNEGYWVPPMESGRMKSSQLFQVKKDIGQKNNVAEKYPKRVQAMEKRIKEIRY